MKVISLIGDQNVRFNLILISLECVRISEFLFLKNKTDS